MTHVCAAPQAARPSKESLVAALDPAKFRNPALTATGGRRAVVALGRLHTLWFNTGTLCNVTCAHCYIESSPRNDRLAYLTLAEVEGYLDEIERDALGTELIGFTGGEPFLNPALPEMIEAALGRGFRVLVLTNAMRPMMRLAARLRPLARYGERLTMRVSLDHHSREIHERERGPRSWAPGVAGLRWLAAAGFRVALAGRRFTGETEAELRRGYARLLSDLDIALDTEDPEALVLFPEMDPDADVPEITEACWAVLRRRPEQVMCASARMVVRRRDEPAPSVVACTLLPYDGRFALGATLREAARPVALNHPHCARFCVLGGAACSG
jgi:uncharacterized Fe-S cluster-containing radical SAM superfamily protein